MPITIESDIAKQLAVDVAPGALAATSRWTRLTPASGAIQTADAARVTDPEAQVVHSYGQKVFGATPAYFALRLVYAGAAGTVKGGLFGRAQGGGQADWTRAQQRGSTIDEITFTPAAATDVQYDATRKATPYVVLDNLGYQELVWATEAGSGVGDSWIEVRAI